MSVSYVKRLLHEGKYSDASYEAGMLDQVDSLFYQSRIAELTGYFHKALDLASDGYNFAKSIEDRIRLTAAKAYAHWRLFSFGYGLDLLHEYQTSIQDLAFGNPSLAGLYYNIEGLLYWKPGKLEEAFASFEKALIYRKDAADQYAISYTLNNLGNTYLTFRDLPKAHAYYEEAYQIRTSLGYSPALAASANSFGRLYDALNQFVKAKEHHLECLNLWKQVGNTQFIGKAYRFLAINAFKSGDQQNNQSYWTLSDNCFKEIHNDTDFNTNLDLQKKFKIH